jgi:hypothetical protein
MYDENVLLHRKTGKIMANQRYKKGRQDRFSVGSVGDLFADLTVHHPYDLPAKLTNFILPASSEPNSFTLKMESACTIETMEQTYYVAKCKHPEKPSFYITHYKNLKTYPSYVLLF